MLAVAAGALAAGGAAIMLDNDGASPTPVIVAEARADYTPAPFDEIATVGPQDLNVTVGGEAYSVHIEGDPRLVAQMEVVSEDGRLTIQPRREFQRGFDWGRFDSLSFMIKVPSLERVSVAGSGKVGVDRIEGDEFEANIAGSGDLSIASLQVDDADFTIGGSGSVTAAGNTGNTRVAIGGSGSVHAGGLRSGTASVRIGGSGDVDLSVDEEASISIFGSGDVDIAGPATCSVSRMGSGDVRCNGQTID